MEATDFESLRKQYADVQPVSLDVRQDYGWTLFRLLCSAIKDMKSVECRKILAEYVQNVLHDGTARLPISPDKRVGISPKLHSAMLNGATKMAVVFPDFHFVPFLKLWDIANLQREDYEPFVDESGKRFPSLVQKLTKALAYSMLLHPAETPDGIPIPTAPDAPAYAVCKMMVTKLTTSEVKGRKMTFAHLINTAGASLSCEVHALTAFRRLRYGEMRGMLFDVLLRKTDKVHVEAGIPSSSSVDEVFKPSVGYVEHIDVQHDHIHIYDNSSRHLVAVASQLRPQVGQYVVFTPVIPNNSKFKEAIIRRVFTREAGMAAFGMRRATITYADSVKGFCAWELLPEDDGIVHPIVETVGTLDDPRIDTSVENTSSGYLSQQLLQSKGNTIPAVGTTVGIIAFLKRGKDGTKRPYVVDYECLA